MKVVMFMNSYIDGISGGDMWALEVCKRLVRNGVEIEIVTSELGTKNFSKFLPENIKYNITTYERNPFKNFVGILWLYLNRIIRGISLDLKTKNNDILFATSNFLPDIIPIIFKKGRKAMILHMIPPNPLYGYRGQFIGKINLKDFVRVAFYYINHIVSLILFRIFGDYLFVLPTTIDSAMKFGFHRDKVYVTLNGLDLDLINKIPSQQKEYDSCWLGRVHPQKGIDDLIEIWKKVVKEIPNAKLVIIGDVPDKYSEIIKKKGISKNIILKGFVFGKEKYELMKKSILFIYPSYYESFPITILEALACGLPILVYDLPVYRKVYGNILITAPIGDKDMFAKEIINLLNNTSEREKISKKAKCIVQRYSWDIIADKFWRAINENNKYD